MIFKIMRRTFWSVSHLKNLFEDKYIAEGRHSPFTFLGLDKMPPFWHEQGL